MNKITFIVLRERSSLFRKFVSQPRIVSSSNKTFSTELLQRHKQQKLPSIAQILPERQMNIFTKARGKLKSFISSQTKAKAAGALVYEKIADNINYAEVFECFEMPDTFQSWFLCVQLHVWMTVIATGSEKYGKVFRNSLIDSMWNDVEQRLNELAEMKSSKKKQYLKELVQQFQASLISYDEGILDDDIVLSSALWRTLFTSRIVDPQTLESAVLYLRKQISHLDSINSEDLIYNGSVTFLPIRRILSEEKEIIK